MTKNYKITKNHEFIQKTENQFDKKNIIMQFSFQEIIYSLKKMHYQKVLRCFLKNDPFRKLMDKKPEESNFTDLMTNKFFVMVFLLI